MTLEELNIYKEALSPLVETYSGILTIENAKLIHLEGYRNDAISDSEKPKGFFQKLVGADDEANQKAEFLKEACDSLSFVIEMIRDRMHVAQIILNGDCDPLFLTDPDTEAVAEVMKHYINGRDFLVNIPLLDVFELYEWNMRRIEEDIQNDLVGVIKTKDLETFNRWSSSQHQNETIRNFLYENFSVTSLY